MVTFCCTTAWGSIFSIAPRKVLSGNASTVTVAAMPAASWPTSVSSTRVRTRMSSRLAMMKSVVPPDTFWVADWITWPYSTCFSRIVPAMGARMVTSVSRSVASSRFVSARTCAACALANSSWRDSYSWAVITSESRSVRERVSWSPAIRSLAFATSRSAVA